MTRTRVGISLLYVSPKRVGGIGVYAASIVRQLIHRGCHEYVLFVPRAQAQFWQDVLPDSAAEIVYCGPDPDRLVARVLYEQFVLPRLARRRGVEVMFFPHTLAPVWSSPPSIVAIHDLRAITTANTGFSVLKQAYLWLTYAGIRSRVTHIATVSEYCRQEIHEELHVPLESIAVVRNAIDDEFLRFADTDVTAGLEDLPAPYLLSVGSTYPHKRLSAIVDAFEAISQTYPRLNLVFAGVHAGPPGALEELRSRVERSSVAARVHFLPFLNRAQLPRLYARAEALVSASEFEGFGIPIVEAMAMGCPVAASPAAAVVEVLNGTNWLAKDFSIGALVEALLEALKARREDVALIREAQSYARLVFRWAHSASVLEEVCARVAARQLHGDRG